MRNIKLILVATCLVLSASSVFAEEQKITVEQVVQINAGLGQLNCGSKIIKDGAKETQVCDNYKWSPGLNWMIATNQRKAQDIVAQYNKVRNQAINNLARKADGTPTDEAAAKFAVQDREYLDEKVSVEFERFKKTDLEPMNLPPSVLSVLMLIID